MMQKRVDALYNELQRKMLTAHFNLHAESEQLVREYLLRAFVAGYDTGFVLGQLDGEQK